MATIRDVAKLAGVPEKTAARALAGLTMGKRRDAKERAERTLKAAAELGYEPSEIAKSLRRGKTNTIGLLVGSITNRYFASLAETVLDEAEKFGYRIILELTRWNDAKSVECMKHLQRLRVEGLFYASGFFPQEQLFLAKLHKLNFPIMMLSENTIGISSIQRGFSSSMLPAVQHLVNKGREKIHFGVWQTRTLYDENLMDLIRNVCQKLSVEPVIIHLESFEEMPRLAQQKPAALICNAPYATSLFLKGAESIPGYHPDVIGIYDEWNFGGRPNALAGAILVQAEKQIRLATRELIGQIEHGSAPCCMSLESKFYQAEEFATIPTSDFSIAHLLPY